MPAVQFYLEPVRQLLARLTRRIDCFDDRSRQPISLICGVLAILQYSIRSTALSDLNKTKADSDPNPSKALNDSEIDKVDSASLDHYKHTRLLTF